MVLLEVILALALFVTGAAIVGGAFSSAMQATQRARLADRAANLAQAALTRVATGQVALTNASAATFDSDSAQPDPQLQGWTYDVACQELMDVQGIKCVTVTVHAPDDGQTATLTQWVVDPNGGNGP